MEARRRSRRDVLQGIILVPALATALTASMLDSERTWADDDTDTARQYYEDAIGMMERGHWLERCIRKLGYSVSVEPTNSKYLVALGCAYACRAVSIASSYSHRGDRVYSPAEVKAASEALRRTIASIETGNYDEGTDESNPASSAPIISFITQDDGLQLSLSRADVQSLLNSDFSNAQEFWNKSAEAANSSTETLALQTTIAWGLRLLTVTAQEIAGSSFFDKGQLADWEDRAVQSARRVVELAPNASSSYLLLGEILLNPSGFKWLSIDKDVVPTYQKALKYDPHSVSVNFRLYQILDSITPGDGETYLRRAVDCQRSNAYLHFCLAGFLFSKATVNTVKSAAADANPHIPDAVVTEVLAILDRGIAAPNFVPIANCVKPDALLQNAYREVDDEAEGKSYLVYELMSLSKGLANFARQTQQQDCDRSIRCCLSILATANRIDNFLSTKSTFNSKIALMDLMATSVRGCGYKAIAEIYKNAGYEDDYERILAEQKAFHTSTLMKAQQGLAQMANTAN